MTPTPSGAAWRSIDEAHTAWQAARVRAFLEPAYDASQALLAPQGA